MRIEQNAARQKTLAIALTALLLTGCATFSRDGGLDDVSAMTKERIGQTVQRGQSAEDAAAVQANVAPLLAQALTPDAAVRIALANNRGLQAAFAEMAQMAMGLMGFWVTHPKNPNFMRVDRDFVFLLGNYDIEPGSYTPKVNTMLDFNLWTINTRVFPGVDSMNVRQGDGSASAWAT